jgi:predicted permease
MGAFFNMLSRLSLFVLLGVPGFVLARLGKIEEKGRAALVNVLLYVAMPFLVFSSLLKTDVRSLQATEWITCAVFPVVIMGIVAGVCVPLFRGNGDKARIGRFCATFANCGFLGLPLAESLFPDRPAVALFISIYNILSTVLLYVLGGVMLSDAKNGAKAKNWVKILVSPLTVGAVLGVLCSLWGVGERLAFLTTFAAIPAQMTTPLSMTVLGCLLATLPPRPWWREGGLWLAAAVKLILSPLLTVGILFVLTRLCGLPMGVDAMLALLLSTAVSTAASAPSMAEDYGRDPHYAAALTLGSTLLCLITLPLNYWLFSLLF